MSNKEQKRHPVTVLPDGSAFTVMSIPLPKDHWIYGDAAFEPPPMVLKMGLRDEMTVGIGNAKSSRPFPIETFTKQEVAEKIRAAGRYAVRSATMKGTEMDFDPDALLQNLVVGFLGYWTEDGLDHDDAWANPPDKQPQAK